MTTCIVSMNSCPRPPTTPAQGLDGIIWYNNFGGLSGTNDSSYGLVLSGKTHLGGRIVSIVRPDPFATPLRPLCRPLCPGLGGVG
jgi:hypothetical protein